MMGAFIAIVGLVLIGLSLLLMLTGVIITLKDVIWGSIKFDAIDGLMIFLGGIMTFLLGLMIAGLSTAFMG
uniref:Uncharacterized protein n=1 Tax=Siphoviridae sp. ctBCr48 TaxID=2827802 RepID=A0A8S5SIA5_9CAUD|nr:MAG TPA: hypothetical protein [Siphoviridae sp. ctBCr48]